MSIKDHVVIIDEAHNLMDAIAGVQSMTVSLRQFDLARAQLTAYVQKFRNRLKGKNRVYVTQTIRLMDSLISYLAGTAKLAKDAEAVADMNLLMAGKGVDQINLYKLSRYLQESKLARKVEGYVTHENEKNKGKETTRKEKDAMPVLTHIQSFLITLMNPSAEGKLFFAKSEDDILLKYRLLDPTNHFREIVEDARAVILAGGTMSPMSDYSNYLFSYLAPERLKFFSYGHVTPKENLMALSLSKSSEGVELSFTYERRDSDALIDQLGKVILSLCHKIPDGVVVFFPSYAYLAKVIQVWEKKDSKSGESIMQCFSKLKPPFSESKGTNNTDDLLLAYTRSIDAGKGGLLFSVVGGKLSEGINFSDKLGRGVIVIGLPFPNIQSAEWKAKLEHVEQRAFEQKSAASSRASEAVRRAEAKAVGRDFYENACMRAVNQCIGRAIRHKNDYAAIVLLDKRYDSERIKGKLPAWIRQSLVSTADLRSQTEVAERLRTFFLSKA